VMPDIADRPFGGARAVPTSCPHAVRLVLVSVAALRFRGGDGLDAGFARRIVGAVEEVRRGNAHGIAARMALSPPGE